MANEKVKKCWFKRRRYGYGWTPITWQGWSVVASFILIVFAGSLLLGTPSQSGFSPEIAGFLLFVLVCVLVLFWMGVQYGPKPKWRWGKKDSDDPHEDF